MIVILLGPPGVGKGTQRSMLEEEGPWRKVVTGDLLREAARAGSELGRKAKAYMDAGDLVPDDLIIDLVREKLEAMPDGADVVFDGFPRTEPQARALDALLEELGTAPDRVVLFTAPDDVLVKRVAGRRTCPECGAIYNVHFDPPGTGGICDECGAELFRREDDRPESVKRRLEVYREETEPVVEYYVRSDVPVSRIDADREPGEVQASLRREIGR